MMTVISCIKKKEYLLKAVRELRVIILPKEIRRGLYQVDMEAVSWYNNSEILID